MSLLAAAEEAEAEAEATLPPPPPAHQQAAAAAAAAGGYMLQVGTAHPTTIIRLDLPAYQPTDLPPYVPTEFYRRLHAPARRPLNLLL
jgi:hypothetical protein